jgi:hypothetical protein
MKTHHILLKHDDLELFIDWLKTRPEGMCKVLILAPPGENVVSLLLARTAQETRSFGN